MEIEPSLCSFNFLIKIAIIGPGNVGSRLAKLFVLASHEVILGSRNAGRAAAIAAPLGEKVKGMTANDADADVVVMTTPWANNVTLDVIKELGDLTGKIVIDCTNPLAPD